MSVTKTPWWKQAVIYQVYPRSFQDSDGDGIGDIPGIISRLDYLSTLGIDAIWLSPVYRSPQDDNGYDISDYEDIDPMFGTLEDMDRLIREAGKRGIRIIMDLVLNHSSDEHRWFLEAKKSRDNPYHDYYIWRNGDGVTAPNGMQSSFGGSAWEDLPGHPELCYLHYFHKKQPDLNWENPALREEVYKMINWWLDKGLAGFRIDAIINIKKALPFRDYPADRDDGLSDIGKMLHEAKGVGEFLGEMRDRCFKPHDAFTVGEVFNEKAEELPDFIGDNGYFSTMFDFAETVFGGSQAGWHEASGCSPDDYRNCVFATQKKIGDIGYISNIIENHDEPRGVSRYIPEGEATVAAKKLLATVYFNVKGLPWIYQGQEIGMENIPVTSIDEVDDISSIDNYKVALRAGVSPEKALHFVEMYGRDNARTPFQWTSGENAGFTAGTPWLRVNPNKSEINLADEQADPDSLFNYYKKLIALRKNSEYAGTLVYGGFEPYLADEPRVMAYFREGAGKRLLVLANYQAEARELPLPEGERKVVLSNLPEVSFTESGVFLKGYQAVILGL